MHLVLIKFSTSGLLFMFTSLLVLFERFFSSLRSLLFVLRCVLEVPSLFRAISSFSPGLNPFRAACYVFSNSLVFSSDLLLAVPFERFAPCSQILQSLWSGLFLVLKFSKVCFERFALCFQTRQSFSSGLLLVLKVVSPCVCSLLANSLVSFERFVSFSSHLERFAPCSQIPESLSSGLLLVLKGWLLVPKLLIPFRAVCSLSSKYLTTLERFAHGVFKLSSPFSSSLRHVLKFSSLFRAACPLFSNSLVSFERLAPCSQIL